MHLEGLPTELLAIICALLSHDDMISALRMAGASRVMRRILEHQSKRVVKEVTWTKNRKDFSFLRLQLATFPCEIGFHIGIMTWDGRQQKFVCIGCVHHLAAIGLRLRRGIYANCLQNNVTACEECARSSFECSDCARNDLSQGTWDCCNHHINYHNWRRWLRAKSQLRQTSLRVPGDLGHMVDRPLFKMEKRSEGLAERAIDVSVPDSRSLELLKCLDVPWLYVYRQFDKKLHFRPKLKRATLYALEKDLPRIETFLTKHAFQYQVRTKRLHSP